MRLASLGGVTRTGAARPSPACGRRRTLCVTRVVRNGDVAHQRTQRNRPCPGGGGGRWWGGGGGGGGGVWVGGGRRRAPAAHDIPPQDQGGAGQPLAGDGGV